MSSIPQLNLGTAALVIFVMCAGFVMVRGMTRMLIGTAVLAMSAWLGFVVWQAAPALSVGWTGRSLAVISVGLPTVVFLATFFGIRWVLKMLFNPFGTPNKSKPSAPLTLARFSFRLLISLIPASLLCLIGATIIHHVGSVAEIRSYAEKSLGTPESSPTQYFRDLKSSVQNALPPSLLRFLDPLADPSRIALAKAIADPSAEPPHPVLDPATGKPIPRAIIVESPELTQLARTGKYGDLLRHPILSKLLAQPNPHP